MSYLLYLMFRCDKRCDGCDGKFGNFVGTKHTRWNNVLGRENDAVPMASKKEGEKTRWIRGTMLHRLLTASLGVWNPPLSGVMQLQTFKCKARSCSDLTSCLLERWTGKTHTHTHGFENPWLFARQPHDLPKLANRSGGSDRLRMLLPRVDSDSDLLNSGAGLIYWFEKF